MRIIILICFFSSIYAFGCEANCAVCHPSIVDKQGNYTKGHEGLKTCVTCHTPEELSKIDMGEEACGQDCYECHDKNKIVNSGVKEHEILVSCDECHMAKKEILEIINSPLKSPKNSLKSLLK